MRKGGGVLSEASGSGTNIVGSCQNFELAEPQRCGPKDCVSRWRWSPGAGAQPKLASKPPVRIAANVCFEGISSAWHPLASLLELHIGTLALGQAVRPVGMF